MFSTEVLRIDAAAEAVERIAPSVREPGCHGRRLEAGRRAVPERGDGRVI